MLAIHATTVTIPMEWLEYVVGKKLQDKAISRLEEKDCLDFVRPDA